MEEAVVVMVTVSASVVPIDTLPVNESLAVQFIETHLAAASVGICLIQRDWLHGLHIGNRLHGLPRVTK